MGSEEAEVVGFLNALEHPKKEALAALRGAILASDDEITERIKWNAPSFCFRGEDRVTFRLQPGDRLQLVFHRGAKVRDDAAGFSFDDPSGLIEWAATDRGTVSFADLDDVRSKQERVTGLVGAWMRAST